MPSKHPPGPPRRSAICGPWPPHRSALPAKERQGAIAPCHINQGAGDASGLPFSITQVSSSLLPDTEQASWAPAAMSGMNRQP
jgi:hypothetical protein